MKLTIRKAAKKDIDVICDMIASLAGYVGLKGEVTAAEDDLQRYLFGPDGFIEVFIGYFAEEPVAMLICYPSFSTFIGKPAIHIEDFYIKPEYRNRGVGRNFLNFSLSLPCKEIVERLSGMQLSGMKMHSDFTRRWGLRS